MAQTIIRHSEIKESFLTTQEIIEDNKNFPYDETKLTTYQRKLFSTLLMHGGFTRVEILYGLSHIQYTDDNQNRVLDLITNIINKAIDYDNIASAKRYKGLAYFWTSTTENKQVLRDMTPSERKLTHDLIVLNNLPLQEDSREVSNIINYVLEREI